MSLTETRIRALKPQGKPYKLTDGKGLHLLVTPAGGRLWRYRYRFAGRENMLGLGQYPDVSLKQARDRRDDARKLLAAGVNPAAQKKAEKQADSNTFAAVAAEWLAGQARVLEPSTHKHAERRLATYLNPYIGTKPIADIDAPMLLDVLRRIEHRGTLETCRRVRELAGRVFRYAIATGRARHDVAAALKGAIATPVATHFASITKPQDVGQLLRSLWGYVGAPHVAVALKLLPYTFVRPGDLRGALWSEFDLGAAEWRIPGPRMKMRTEHVVPLSRQALELVRELQPLTGSGALLFPSLRSDVRPISENTLNAALRRLGYDGDTMTSHGFRSTASTLLNEQGWHPDLIELQLAHAERNKVRAAYNKAQRLEERRRMMQAWADYLDGLRTGATVVGIRAHAQASA